jgi:fusarinine C synthase
MSNKTLPTFIIAAWALLLSTYEGSDDIIFGTVTSGRESQRSDAFQIAGPMIATGPLRLAVGQQATVAGFLDMIQRKVAETARHAHFGLQSIAKLGDDEKRDCSLQTLLVMQRDIVYRRYYRQKEAWKTKKAPHSIVLEYQN